MSAVSGSAKGVRWLEDQRSRLKKEVVRTLPFTPVYANVYLGFGSVFPAVTDKEYSSWAQQNGVGPFEQHVHIDDLGSSFFYQPIKHVERASGSLLDVVGEAQVPHAIRVVGSGEAFDGFRRGRLSSLVEEYEVLDAEFWVSIVGRRRDRGSFVSLGLSTCELEELCFGERTVIGDELGVFYSQKFDADQSVINEKVLPWAQKLSETYGSASLPR